MRRRGTFGLVAGLALILVGFLLLARQFIPGFGLWLTLLQWPFYFIAAGVLLFFTGLLTGVPGLSVPACLVSGIGMIFAWQRATGRWESWGYVWPLTLTAIGAGMVLSALLGPRERRRTPLLNGVQLMVFSLALFFVLDALFGTRLLGAFWPVALVGVGVWMIARNFLF